MWCPFRCLLLSALFPFVFISHSTLCPTQLFYCWPWILPSLILIQCYVLFTFSTIRRFYCFLLFDVLFVDFFTVDFYHLLRCFVGESVLYKLKYIIYYSFYEVFMIPAVLWVGVPTVRQPRAVHPLPAPRLRGRPRAPGTRRREAVLIAVIADRPDRGRGGGKTFHFTHYSTVDEGTTVVCTAKNIKRHRKKGKMSSSHNAIKSRFTGESDLQYGQGWWIVTKIYRFLLRPLPSNMNYLQKKIWKLDFIMHWDYQVILCRVRYPSN